MRPRHKAILNQLSGSLRAAYEISFQGLKVPALSNAVPPLRVKQADNDMPDKIDVKAILNRARNTELEHQPPAYSKANDWVGIEIECYIPRKSVYLLDFDVDHEYASCSCGDDECSDCNTDCSNGECNCYDAQKVSVVAEELRKIGVIYTCAKTDGSLDDTDEFIGIEICVLTKLSNPTSLRKVCEFLEGHGAKVDTSCGLHVHLDARDMESAIAEGMALRLRRALPHLTNLVPPSRRENKYCTHDFANRFAESRYSKINCLSLEKHGSVEVRYHSGTTNFDKIFNWASLCYFIFRFMETVPRDFHKFVEALPVGLQDWAVKRAEKFADSTPTLSIEEGSDELQTA